MQEEGPELPLVLPKRRRPIWRAFFVVLGALLFGLLFFQFVEPLLRFLNSFINKDRDTPVFGVAVAQVAGAVAGFVAGAGLGNLFHRSITRFVQRWDNMPPGGKVTVFIGVFVGLIASVPFMFVLLTFMSGQYAALVVATLLLIAGFSTLAIAVLQSIEDILPWTRGQVKARRRGIKLLDTNVIIDGRIVDLGRTGFLEGPLYIPGFVLDELQYIADSPDAMRRQRGRRGLDVLQLMKNDHQVEVRVHDHLAPDIGDEVDARLVRLARAMGADIVTNDVNLNRVATLQEVKVLNINDLALALRPNVLPSETMELAVIREGNQPGQGVGYLDDGTMVVVENGRSHLGETIQVVVTQVIQTERGKMIFAHPDGDNDAFIRRRPTTPRRP